MIAAIVVSIGCSATADTGKQVTLDSTTDACAGIPDLTGDSLLALLRPTYVATYTAYRVEASLSLAMAYDGGEITCYPPGPEDNAASLEITVDTQVVTSDGSFDESIHGWVQLTRSIPPGDDRLVSFHADEAVASVRGTFTWPGSWKTFLVTFDGFLVLDTGMTTGNVSLYESNGPDDTYGERVASWR